LAQERLVDSIQKVGLSVFPKVKCRRQQTLVVVSLNITSRVEAAFTFLLRVLEGKHSGTFWR
jgi:hypothetical protein